MSETGRLVAPDGARTRAGRRYLWLLSEDRAQVLFADGRPFHDLPVGAAQAEVRHDCPPDLYQGTFTVSDPDRWRVDWRVAGPRKDYVSETEFLRA